MDYDKYISKLFILDMWGGGTLLIYCAVNILLADRTCIEAYKTLDDIAYLDDGQLIFSFGKDRIITEASEEEYTINKLTKIERCKKNDWFLLEGYNFIRVTQNIKGD